MKPTYAIAATVLVITLSTSASAAESALDECWAGSDNQLELGDCLRTLKSDVDGSLANSYDEALEAQAEIDDIVGQRQASRTLQRAQKAFELYRDLNCHQDELQAGAGTGSGDFFLGCWIDMTRERIAQLERLLPEPDETLSVVGDWFVDSLNGGKVMPGTRLTLVIESEDRVGGDGGCNRFFGPMELDPVTGPEGSIEIGPLGATRKACGDMIDEQEMRFLNALDSSEQFAITGDKLSLKDGEGSLLVRFSQMQ
ncbi:META domain-containing protein [Denitrobaculum tricleocarpae]|uniref:META domain-containing protein n=1 Tax=Denitrobaculum tricleocarpae TaxID=2591009 RepID=A0A545T3Y7_9PROT|nr:META domain-containing protein [Denitrobaculum tricleocarpae]TQV71924.1 META domain-containing protein [Denitrobaculum tricleocarpae]